MVFGNSFHLGKTIRIFPYRLLVCFIFVLSLYIIAEISFITPNTYLKTNVHFEDDLEKDKLIELLLDRKLKLNNTSDEGLKKSFSEFLDTMNKKINTLEERIKELETSIKQKKSEKPQPVDNVKVNSLDNPDCPIPSFEGYSACHGKIQWMKAKWTSDKCYGEWGVDGSECSIVKYLSEVERFCPKLPSSNQKTPSIVKNTTVKLTMPPDFNELYKQLDADKHLEWIALRIRRMEPKWRNASHILREKPYFKTWQKKSILIHLGLLSEENGWNIAKNAFSGGPLGELVQWSDVIASLYALGHDITMTVTTGDLKNELQQHLDSIKSANCPPLSTLFDVIYTDIGGLKTMKKVMGLKFHLFQCTMRIVDSFGTEPEYNFPSYATRKKMKSEWGKWNFFPKQFNTMFPHTPDNTFLGFVIESIDNLNASIPKQNKAVVYGKRDVFWKDKEAYLDAIHDVVEIHGTVNEEKHQYIRPYVINHGVMPVKQLHELLLSAKVFVGLSFPYEGPAPLEAIADGAVFLNPIFKEGSPLYEAAAKFYLKKPTNRKLTSQHPYAENFIGLPHVRMVDLDNVTDVKRIVREIIAAPPVKGYMPYEFTCYGVLERIGFHVEKQDFCGERTSWPPLSSLKILVTDSSSTCAEACLGAGAICEPHFFPDINKRSTFKMLDINCEKFESPRGTSEEIDFPSYKDSTCYIQGNPKLFSCAGRYTDTRRLCPCRDYVKGQVAMCKDCFS